MGTSDWGAQGTELLFAISQVALRIIFNGSFLMDCIASRIPRGQDLADEVIAAPCRVSWTIMRPADEVAEDRRGPVAMPWQGARSSGQGAAGRELLVSPQCLFPRGVAERRINVDRRVTSAWLRRTELRRRGCQAEPT